MKLPRVRHRVIRPLGKKDLYLCEDARSSHTVEVVEGGTGGGGYNYFLHKEQRSTIQKDLEKLQRKMLRNSAQGNKRSSARTDGVG